MYDPPSFRFADDDERWSRHDTSAMFSRRRASTVLTISHRNIKLIPVEKTRISDDAASKARGSTDSRSAKYG